MATLTSTKIKNTYDALLKSIDNDAIGTTAKQITDGLGNLTPLYISTTQIGIGVTPESGLNLHVFGDAKIGSNLTVIGNLVVEGSTTTVGTDTLTVKDPLIVLANNNTSTDAVDIGFYGKYTPSGTTLYSGLFREALTGKYRLFKDLQVEPTTTVNTSGTGYAQATLIAALEGNVIGNVTGTVSSLSNHTTSDLAEGSNLYYTADRFNTAFAAKDTDDLSEGSNLYFTTARARASFSEGTGISISSGEISIDSTVATLTDTQTLTNKTIDADNNTISDLEVDNLKSGVLDTDLSSVSASNDTLASAKAIKTYVDNQISAEDLDFSGDSGTGSVDLDSQTLTIAGTTNEIETSASSQILTIGLPDDVTISSQLTVGASSSTDAPTIKAISASTGENILLEGTDTSAASAPDLVLYRNAGAPADNDTLGVVEFRGRNDVDSGVRSYSGVFSRIIDASEQKGALTFSVNSGANYVNAMAIHNTGTNQPKVIIGNTDAFATPTDTLDVDGTLNVSSTGSFGGQVTIPETPSASTDAASKGYVDAAVEGQDTLAEILAIGNTTGGTSIDVSANDDINLSDSSEIHLGDGADLVIKHDGTSGTFNNKTGSLNFYQLQDDGDIKFFCDDGTGATENYLQIDGGEQRIKVFNQMRFSDNVELRLGTGSDLKIYHDGSNSFIDEAGTGDLFIRSTNGDGVYIYAGGTGSSNKRVFANSTGSVDLYYGSTKRLETTSTGVSVTGEGVFAGTVKGTAFLINKTSVAGIGASLGDINGAELGPGYLTLSRDDTADAKQILFEKNDVEHSYLQTTSSGLTIGGADVTFTGDVSVEDNLYLTDAGTVRGKIQLNSSDRDDLDIKAVSLGSNMKFFTADSEKMRIDSSGNVAIGETDPIADSLFTLHNGDVHLEFSIDNAVADTARIFAYDRGVNAHRKLQLRGSELTFVSGSSGTEKMRIDSSGNVGIGTTSPSHKLQVDSNGSSNSVIRIDADDNRGASRYALDIVDDDTNSRGSVRISTTSGPSLIATRNVGIGTTLPDALLDIGVNNIITLDDTGSSTGFIGMGSFNDGSKNRAEGASYFGFGLEIDRPNANISFNAYASTGITTSGTNILVLKNTGNVGIGTDSPLAKFVVKQTDAELDVTTGSDNVSFECLDRANTNNGIDMRYYARNGNYQFFTGTYSERMRITSGGNVGIGTTSPDSLLHVSADLTSANTGTIIIEGRPTGFLGDDIATIDFHNNGTKRSDIRMERGNTASDSQLVFSTSDTGTLTDRFIINEIGNVGIGTSTIPADHILQVSNEGQSYARVALTNSQTGNASGDGLIFQMENLNSIIKNQENGTLGFGTNGRESDLFINSSGNVGIGTTSPSYELDVDGYVGIRHSTSPQLLFFETGSAYTDGMRILRSQDKLHLTYGWNANEEAITIVGGTGSDVGNVGIGFTDPSNYKLKVNGAVSGTNIYANSAGGSFVFGASTSEGEYITRPNGTNDICIIAGGNVGIGTTSPDAKLEITTLRENGIRLSSSDVTAFPDELLSGIEFYSPDTSGGAGVKASIQVRYNDGDANSYMTFSTGTNTERMRITSGGDLHVDGDVVAYSTTISDKRLKDDVKPLESSLDKVMNLKGVEYIWNNGSRKGQKDIGFIAQEVEDVIPEIVREKQVIFNQEEKYKTVDYEKITAVLVEAVKELTAKVERLENKCK